MHFTSAAINRRLRAAPDNGRVQPRCAARQRRLQRPIPGEVFPPPAKQQPAVSQDQVLCFATRFYSDDHFSSGVSLSKIPESLGRLT